MFSKVFQLFGELTSISYILAKDYSSTMLYSLTIFKHVTRFVCVKGFDQKSKALKPLMVGLHLPKSKLAKLKN